MHHAQQVTVHSCSFKFSVRSLRNFLFAITSAIDRLAIDDFESEIPVGRTITRSMVIEVSEIKTEER